MKYRYLLLPFIALTSPGWAGPLDGLSAAEVNGPAAVAQLTQPQPPAKLIVDPPLAGPLSKGATGSKTCVSSRYSARKR